jgi:hypothetical protein
MTPDRRAMILGVLLRLAVVVLLVVVFQALR